ncbi:DUF397 domain-containing protein [Streptomyces sp. NBC_01433]|uniref:DUF397 domain-containing protein n=1 Tax=Streptomyces sp. NBC_01433 TaxID=2903864 RepID=UPI0022537BA1|nr:DUF397 domain-containing protein [Streptomyces sp. NBC_01433]MCX4677122.1 DUF397 domain-containing protein [Streptomyces sp. NBC_01433]
MHTTEPTTTDGVSFTAWRKSSYSGGANGDCLEVADGHPSVPVRDSKTPAGPAVAFSPDGWSTFLAALKNGHLTA